MNTCIKTQAILALSLLSGSLLAAASSGASTAMPEALRTLMLLEETESDRIMYLPVGLQAGMSHFLGLRGKKRNYKMADTCFRSVIGVKLLPKRDLYKAWLCRAIMHLNGGYGIEANPIQAFRWAKAIINHSEASAPDKIYAFLVFVDCLRMPDNQFKKEIGLIDVYASQLRNLIEELGPEYDALKSEALERMPKPL